MLVYLRLFFFSSRRRHTRSLCDWSSDVCSSDLVLTRLPDSFRKKRRAPWTDANKPGHEIDSFLEGPSFDRAGNLYVTDIPFGRVFRISPQLEWTLVAEYDGWPNGS